MAARKLLLRAAELLEEDARAGAESCELNGRQWTCDCTKDGSGRCAAQRDHDERWQTATALKQAATKGAK